MCTSPALLGTILPGTESAALMGLSCSQQTKNDQLTSRLLTHNILCEQSASIKKYL